MEEKEVVEVKPAEEKKEEKAEVVEAKPAEGKIGFSIAAFACGVTGLCLLFSGWGAIVSIALGIAAIILYKKGAENRQPWKIFKKLGCIFGKLSLILGIIVTVLVIALLIVAVVLYASGAVDQLPAWLLNWIGYHPELAA